MQRLVNNKRPFYQQLGLVVMILPFSSICLEATRAVGTKNDARARSFAGFAKNGYSHLPRSTPYVVFSYRIFILAFAIYCALPCLYI